MARQILEGFVFRISEPVDIFRNGPYRLKVTCPPMVVALAYNEGQQGDNIE